MLTGPGWLGGGRRSSAPRGPLRRSRSTSRWMTSAMLLGILSLRSIFHEDQHDEATEHTTEMFLDNRGILLNK
ncbi:hypothetical protein RB195_013808 [Necator americanus]|uniref:Uncharacterized protein n=1 Tax=Necator americanus TaxID=51031 RepID=A0ABR1DYG1_NECAM